MLSELRIRNYALMEELSVGFSPGLNIMTGETGAGKSIIIGALGLALGERVDQDLIRTGAEEAVSEAVFDLSTNLRLAGNLESMGAEPEDGLLILKRAVSRAGRTKCWLNNSPVTLSVLRRVGDELLDMHGQHEHQSLLKVEKHLDLLDGFGGLLGLSDEVAGLYERYGEIEKSLEKKRNRLAQLKEREELLRFQLKEIEEAKLSVGEDERLESERLILENAESLLSSTQEAYEILSGRDGSVLESLGSVEKLLRQASEVDSSLRREVEALSSIGYRLDDLWRSLLSYQKNLEFEPERLEEVRGRVELIGTLKRKYVDSIEGMLGRRDEIEAELKSLEEGEETTDALKAELGDIRKEISKKVADLSKLRREKALKLERKVLRELSDLGMGGAKFKASFELEEDPDGLAELEGKSYRTTERGVDRVEFLISPNPGEELKPLRKIASGGEISRMMLALKSILAEADSVPSLIFDEIDLGIGGKVAEAVGKKLKSISSRRQVICITHLPHIAVYGTTHFEVRKFTEKGRTYTEASFLDKEGRVREVARMLGGEKVAETAVRHAKRMLKKVKEG